MAGPDRELPEAFAKLRKELGGSSAASGNREATAVPEGLARKRREVEISLQIERLPILPTVIYEVLKLANADTTNASDFEAIVSKDQALTAKMLKMVNSAYYSIPKKITTIREAVVVLGFKTLKSIVLAATTTRLFRQDSLGYGFDRAGLWKHSYGTAVTAKLLAIRLGWRSEESDEAFVGGLLHDLGKLILEKYLLSSRDKFARKLQVDPAKMIEVEQELLGGFNHVALGKEIAVKWKLPEAIVRMIASHHHPEPLPEEQPSSSAYLVHLANVIARSAGWGILPSFPIRTPLAPGTVEMLKLTREDILAVQNEAASMQREMEELVKRL